MGAVSKALLVFRTVRHLRPVQWVYLPLRRLQGPAAPPPDAPAEADEANAARMAEALAAWDDVPDAEALRRADEVLRGRFVFLNHAEDLGDPEWLGRPVSHLWSYNLQYFAYAADLARAWRATGDERYVRRFEALAASWIDVAGDGAGDGWEPYALSTRIVHWTEALLLFGGALRSDARERIVRSLRRQVAALAGRMERHLQANHLQRNYLALAVGGLFLAGPEAARWRRAGLAGSWSAVLDQVRADGGHVERSPTYHALALADFLELAHLCRAVGEEVPAPVIERLGAMTRALGVLGRPDGTLHLFNDAAQGIAPPADRLARLARLALGVEIAAASGLLELRESGFLGWADASAGERLVIDCGAPSPAYQPGHAHCGALGFELDLLGRPALVDSGCHGYEGDPFREYVRSTRAHNTVAVGGREQSEVWGTFRVGRRAKVLEAAHSVGDGRYRFSGALRPFHGNGVHRRTIERGADGWRVEDRVDGAAGERVTAWLHFHPDWSVETRDGGAVARSPGGEIAIDVFGADEVRVIRGERSPVQGWYCPEFGRALPAAALELTIRANDGRAFGCVLHSTEVLSPES